MSRQSRRSIRVVVPRPDRVRTLDGIAFGWLDARLQHQGWLRVVTPQACAVYTFLCLAADRSGVSFYRRERMARELGLDDAEVIRCLSRLCDLGLVAHRPYRPGAADGFWQVLSLPEEGPPPLLPDGVLPTVRPIPGTQE